MTDYASIMRRVITADDAAGDKGSALSEYLELIWVNINWFTLLFSQAGRLHRMLNVLFQSPSP
jgi:hypothetical protein